MLNRPKLTVYLSGGMRGDWRQRVQAAVPCLTYINPQDHGLDIADEYTAWDLLGVRMADVIFAYLEDHNPSGIGLALEVGYAKALGKTVIFVDQRGGYTDIIRSAADVWCESFEQGLAVLQRLAILGR